MFFEGPEAELGLAAQIIVRIPPPTGLMMLPEKSIILFSKLHTSCTF